MAKWEAEFSALMGSQREELDEYSTGMQQAWESGLGDFSSSDTFATKPLQFDPDGIPLLDDYVFGTLEPNGLIITHTRQKLKTHISIPHPRDHS